MSDFSSIKNLVLRFKHQGIEKTSNGTVLIGKAPFLGEEAWLNKIYEPLTALELDELENSLQVVIPFEFKKFLTDFSNGLNILASTLSIYGLRKQQGRSLEASRQPFSIITLNIRERPKNSQKSYLFIGAYNWDGSLLYIDTKTNTVHCCQAEDATPKYHWNSFVEMLKNEISRLYSLVDDTGKELIEDQKTIPY